MRTLVVLKERINERKKIIYFWSNGRALKKEEMKEDPIIRSNGCAQIKKINQ